MEPAIRCHRLAPLTSVLLLLTLPAYRLTAGEADLRAYDLRCEGRVDPLGIDEARPRLSWKLTTSSPHTRGQSQSAWHLLVASRPGELTRDDADLWDSGRVAGDRSLHLEYGGKRLESHQQCWWKVRVWDAEGRPGPWSEPAHWSMGILEPESWKARWIGLETETGPAFVDPDVQDACWIWFPEEDPVANAPVGTRWFRSEIELPADTNLRKGTVFITADNSFTLFVNGEKAATGSDFHQVVKQDVTRWLRSGRNVLAAEATNVGDAPNPAGLLCVLRLELEDGEKQVISTDESWHAWDREPAGWNQVLFKGPAGEPARVLGANGIAPWGEVGEEDLPRLPARLLRKEFQVEAGLQRATATVSGLGLHELEINGRKAGDHVLSPALTDYRKRVLYVTHDVTDLLEAGTNALGVHLGNGRYFAPRRTVPVPMVHYGCPRLICQLRLEYADGTTREVFSDDSWKVTPRGPIRANNEFDGEEYDARLEQVGWSRPGFDDSAWSRAELVSPPGGVLRAQMTEPIRVTQTIRPVSLRRLPGGATIYDLGQNIVGWCRLRVRGPRGAKITLRHAEALQADGALYLDNIRSARVTDTYTLKGEGLQVYEPRFTYHGFRYVEVTGWPGEPGLSSLEGRVVHDDLDRAGCFSCSNELLNRIHRNIEWGVRGNYRSIPTDCPQRDERMGWLGDRSAESRGESYLHDVWQLYTKWLLDIEDAQKPSGSVPDVAPAYWTFYTDNVTWPSSTVIIPAMLYEQYGDRRIIERHYASMKSWIEHMLGYMEEGIIPRDRYGDWCVPPEEQHLIHSRDPARKTAGPLIASAYFYHDLLEMARYARLLGHDDDQERFTSRAAGLKTAYNRIFYRREEGCYDNGTQTSSVLSLAFGLVPDGERERVFGHLVRKILKESRGHIGTGLIGGQWLMRVLSDNGRPDIAYTIATQTSYPGWGYMIEKDATTIWELWNGDTADPAMNSMNHVMLVGDLLIWMYEYLAGIRPAPERTGFRHVILKPHPTGDLTHAEASIDSPQGLISTCWRIEGDRLHLEVTLPANTTGTVHVPAEEPDRVSEGGQPAGEAPCVRFLRMEDGCAVYEIGSGSYEFESPR